MSKILHLQRPEFGFKSEFSVFIRKAFINHELIMLGIAENTGLSIPEVSNYYNDKRILTHEHAVKFSDLLKTIGINVIPIDLIAMQRKGIFYNYSSDLLDLKPYLGDK